MYRDKRKFVVVALALIGATMYFSSAPAMAQATRTWVSGVGDDANPCSRTAPCKTWAGAISKTAASGEIDALDPGGFGAVTITKAITLDGGGQVASVLVSGTNGVVVAAGPSDIVILRNLRFNGVNSGINGVLFNSGAMLNVENCDIFGFVTAGIGVGSSTTGRLNVKNTTLVNSTAGISFTGTSTQMTGSIDRTYMNNDNNGIISSAGSPNFTITNSVIAGGGTGINAGSASTRFNVDSSIIEGVSTALNASVSGALIRASNNNLDNNNVNFATAAGATIQSTGNNKVGGGSGAPNGTYSQQ